MKTPVV